MHWHSLVLASGADKICSVRALRHLRSYITVMSYCFMTTPLGGALTMPARRTD